MFLLYCLLSLLPSWLVFALVRLAGAQFIDAGIAALCAWFLILLFFGCVATRAER